jgi:hypothetical protein
MFKEAGLEILDEEGKPLNYEEGVFINKYRKLSDPNKKVARTTVNALLESQEETIQKGENVNLTGIGPGDSGETG